MEHERDETADSGNASTLREVRERRGQRELGTVANALRLLEVMADRPEAGISELAAILGLSKPAVDRLAVTLASAGFAEQNPANKKYQLTPKLVAMAEQIQSRLTIREVAQPHLVGLAEATGETINLGIYSSGTVIYIDKIPSGDLFRIEVRPGTALPAYETALGKAILAYLPEPVVSDYLDTLERDDDLRDGFSSAAFSTELESVRENHFALDRGEILPDVCCVAAPVFGRSGQPIAAVSITTPRSRFEDRLDELATLVSAAAERISIGARQLDLQAPGPEQVAR